MVTIAAPNSIDWFVAYCAAWRLGAVPQPISSRLPQREIDAIMELANPSAVVGVPHPDFGEAVVALIQHAPNAPLNEKQTLEWARSRLAGFKVPKRIFFGELPKNTMGKVQKNVIREKFRANFTEGLELP